MFCPLEIECLSLVNKGIYQSCAIFHHVMAMGLSLAFVSNSNNQPGQMEGPSILKQVEKPND
jgi:hypothetical protein